MKKSAFGTEIEYRLGFQDLAHTGMLIAARDIIEKAKRIVRESGSEYGLPWDFCTDQGARVYVDGQCPEYSTPECGSAGELLVAERSGDCLMARAEEKLQRRGADCRVIKNNTDPKGEVSSGAHENYAVSPSVFENLVYMPVSAPPFSPGNPTRHERIAPQALIAAAWMTFLATRILWTGAGRVVRYGKSHRFEISQRAAFITAVRSLETLDGIPAGRVFVPGQVHGRAFINTRREPHADETICQRLHVICGDSNQCDYAIWLKTGITHLILRMLEQPWFITGLPVLLWPVAALHAISAGTLHARKPLRFPVLENGGLGELTALAIQKRYHAALGRFLCEAGFEADDEDGYLHETWGDALRILGEPLPKQLDDLFGISDWHTKFRLLERHRERDGFSWSWQTPPDAPIRIKKWPKELVRTAAEHLAMLDAQYHGVSGWGFVSALRERGGIPAPFRFSAEELEPGRAAPPALTRAWLRGNMIRRCGTGGELRELLPLVSVRWRGVEAFSLTSGDRLFLDMAEPWGFSAAATRDWFIEDTPFEQARRLERELRARGRVLGQAAAVPEWYERELTDQNRGI